MITVFINKPQFEYDIHSLVKAFYPGEEVKVRCGEKETERVEETDLTILISFEEDGIAMRLEESGTKGNTEMCLEEPKTKGEASKGHVEPEAEGETTKGHMELEAEGEKAKGRMEPEAEGEKAKGHMEQEAERRIEGGQGELETIGSKETQQEERTAENGYWAEHVSDAGRGEKKNVLKQLIYQVLSRHLGKELPWGTLTGIRPTKIAMGMLEADRTEKEILNDMKQAYYISDEKAKLSIDIAKRERKILSSLHYKDGYSLYIGIPFCPTTCIYCSFTSYPIGLWKGRTESYLEALEKEMAYVAEIYRDKVLDTVYIGGGTPTTLEPEELDRLLAAVYRYFDMSKVQEFTVEAGRADSITREKLKVLKRNGITRISVNPQTMKEETLRIIGRRHSVEQVKEAFWLAREEGFHNINMDIILGLPGEGKEDVEYTAAEIKKLYPDSLTVHSLAVKRASKLNQWIEENGIGLLNNTDATMEIAAGVARDMGMEPYYLYRQKNMAGNFENVGYAMPGKYGIYNILIMEEVQTIVALGAGSITKRVYPDGRIERCDNVKDVAQYIDRIDEMIGRKKRLLGDK